MAAMAGAEHVFVSIRFGANSGILVAMIWMESKWHGPLAGSPFGDMPIRDV
ncbi:hypothetical protein I546_5898 [Mycobacterium kansasii 732]|nr:hypothetical protein I546_5898 [Mycobacterium kansasii 732]